MSAICRLLAIAILTPWTGALAVPSGAPVASPESAPASIDLHGKLYRSVFFTGPGALSPADLPELAEPVRARLNKYLSRRVEFQSTYEHKAATFEEAACDAKKRDIERAIVSLIDGPDIARVAADYVRDADVKYTWSGSQAPLGEADYAQKFVDGNSSTPLAPYLDAFVAERQRAAFEMLTREKNVEGARAAARQYFEAMARLRSAADPIFPLLADDLDRQPFVFINVGAHPRDHAVLP
jgi:hypothetical protein